MINTIVIGAGITGLSVSYFSKKPCVILEKENTPGGLCRSFRHDGFTFDFGGHFIHVHHNKTELLVKKLLANNLKKVTRDSWIHTSNVFIPYPFQANLYHLPEKIKNECLKGFINKPSTINHQLSTSFYDWTISTFGKGITKYFMKPYNEKLWTVSSRRLTSDWAAPFVPTPSLDDISRGASTDSRKNFGYNTSFYYPAHGGCQAIIDALAKKTGNIRYNSAVRKINIDKKYVETSDGGKFYYEQLVSTQPLVELINQISGLPKEIAAAKEKLDWNSVTCLNLGIEGTPKPAGGKHWIYFPEKKFVFYRAGIYSNILPDMAPDGCASFYIEMSRRPSVPLRKKELLSKTLSGLRSCGLITKNDKIKTMQWADMPYAYVIYDKYRVDALATINGFLAKHNIHSIGRYGAWKYSFMEESILDAIKTVM